MQLNVLRLWDSIVYFNFKYIYLRVGRLVGWLVGRTVGWSGGRADGRTVGWLIGNHVMFALTLQVPNVLLHHFYNVHGKLNSLNERDFCYFCWKNCGINERIGNKKCADQLAKPTPQHFKCFRVGVGRTCKKAVGRKVKREHTQQQQQNEWISRTQKMKNSWWWAIFSKLLRT